VHHLSPGYRAALLSGRAAAGASRHVLHRGGRVVGGAVLLRLAPEGVREVAAARRITVVSGTNGKSTTTAMVTAALRTAGPVGTNADGANMPHGLAWALATSTAEDMVLEVDESWLPWAVRVLRPHTAVLLNLTRDQLHRKPEIGPLAESWRAAVRAVPRVVAVADDPAVVWVAQGAPTADYVGTGADWVMDSVLCPVCHDLLRDRDGRWWCRCGFRRPDAATEVRDGCILVDDAVLGRYDGLPGAANVANAATAVAAVRDRVDPATALAAVAREVHDVAGRYRELTVEGRRVRLLLAKNPAGWQAVLGMLRDGAATVLSLSADGVDGRDTSWLYDVPFERLRDRRVAVTGPRGIDLAVRLEVADVAVEPPLPSVRAALRRLPCGDVDVVATYSAFQAARRELGVG
jgi:UDP-N-acetylmuramyl tripeptide synthase